MYISIKEPLFCYETGKRKNNEDYIFPAPATATEASRLFIVCDGMGGHEDGEIASKTTAEAIVEYWSANPLQPDDAGKVNQAIAAAVNKMDRLVEEAKGNINMGTTLTLAAIGTESVLVAHAGDSRIYLLRPGAGIIYRSKDHSLVQKWVDAGWLSPEEANEHPMSNIITQVIQPQGQATVFPDVAELKDIKEGDYLFLCSDGVTESIDDRTLVEIITKREMPDHEKMNRIKHICLENSTDNHSAYLIPFV